MKRPFLFSFRARVIGMFVILLLFTQGGGFLLTNTAVQESADKAIRNELATGNRIFNRLLVHNSQGLSDAARIVVADFAFREAIATRDRGTILSVLENHGARINAKLMMLVGLDNKLIADMQRPEASGQVFPFPRLTTQADPQSDSSTAIELVDGQAYQLVVVPVRAPLPIAWVVIGFLLDNPFAADLKALTALDISFITKTKTGEWRVLATTLPTESQDGMESAIGKLRLGSALSETSSYYRSPIYDNLVIPIKESAGNAIFAVLHRHLAEAMEPANRLSISVLWLTSIALLPSVILAILLARSVTRPVSTLAHTARRIARGDYSPAAMIDRDDEIGELAHTLDSMRQGIDEREKKILKLAYRDPLTDLPNRALFNDRLQQAVAQADREQRPVAIMLIDLERFKEVNATLGHQMGDQLLRQVGDRLCQAFHNASDTVARLGGDEFAVLLPGSTCPAAQELARGLLPSLEQPAKITDYRVDVGLCIGIAGFPDHGTDAGILIQRADIALHMAKRSHAGPVVYDPRHDSSTEYNLSIIGEMREGLRRDDFVLYYQPKIRLADQRAACVETLIRWMHPERGLIPPDRFIPLAEQTGNIRAITRWVLDKALQQYTQWRSQGIDLAVAVNVSARDLEDREFPYYVARLLKEYKVLPSYLTLEITESALMEDPEYALGTIDMLDKLGIKLSIDDYGTGYSSLAYIKRLPVNELKIDKAFVTAMNANQDDAIIVRSTIELGHNMGLSVVAEGVENAAVLQILRSMGCDLAQGYYISKPLDAAALERWLKNPSA